MATTEPLLALEQVQQTFHTPRGPIRAVADLTLALHAGEVLCLVGESGSGKTTAGKIAAGLLRPTGGVLRFQGEDVGRLDRAGRAAFRRAVQIVHQDPYASLNPMRTIFETLAAPLRRHRLVRGRAAALRRVSELLVTVDLTPPENFLFKYPHQLSGGQRQRVSLARALTLGPRVIVADEATSMVDVSIRISLLHTLRRLQAEQGVAFLFITHDLAIARYFASEGRIAVMYCGRVVEQGPTPAVIGTPAHPYTRALLGAIPEPDPDRTQGRERVLLRSLEIPSLHALPAGCAFHPRCLHFEGGLCDGARPELRAVERGRRVACHTTVISNTGGIDDGLI